MKGVKDVKKHAVTLFTVALTTSAALVSFARAQSPPTCRIFTAEEVRTVTGVTSGTITQNCRFDTPTTSRICTMRTRLGAQSFDVEYIDKYKSVDDFVDEIRVVPPIARIQTQSRRYISGSGSNMTLAYDYDATRRQTHLSTNVGGNLLVTTYGDWDPLGRPTTATVSSRASTFTLRYKYDDKLRTMTNTGPAGTQIYTYDADGNMIREETADASGRTVHSFKINKTDKICK